MTNSSGHGGAHWRSVVARSQTGIGLLATGAALSVVALVAGLTTSAPAAPLSLRILGPPPVPLVAADRPVSSSSPPVALSIPAIGVTSTLEGLRLNGDGSLQTPRDPNRAGWYADGPAPGDRGAAVVVGHLDSKTGPAVFWRLAGLLPGDRLFVRRADGRTLVFVVDHSSIFPRTNLPTGTVFGASGSELHLITCNGVWDAKIARYDHSLVVFARLAAAGSPTSPAPAAPKAQPSSPGASHGTADGSLTTSHPRPSASTPAPGGSPPSSSSPTPTSTPSPSPSPSPSPEPSPSPSPTPDPVPLPLPSPTAQATVAPAPVTVP